MKKKIEKTLENRCAYYEISREVRKEELKETEELKKKGLPIERSLFKTENYLERGCYKCEGYNEKCPFYINLVNHEKVNSSSQDVIISYQ